MIRVIANMRPAVSACGDMLMAAVKAGKIRTTSMPALSKSQYYDIAVFRKSNALTDSIRQLEDARRFIERFPTQRKYEQEGITQHRWIEYHYSHYVVTLVGLGDLSLILVNVALRLGHPEKLCSSEIIKSNEWVRESPVSKALQRLEKIIQGHRSVRNLYVHRGEPPKLHEVFQSEALDYLKLFSSVDQVGKPVIDRTFLRLAYKSEVQRILKRLDIEIAQTTEAVRGLFDSLLPIYEQHALVLRQQPSRNDSK